MATLEKYRPLKDVVLLGYYRNGEDEVVPFWMSIRYFNQLIIIAWRYVKRNDKAHDVLSEVALKLIEATPDQREDILKLFEEKVKVSLSVKVRHKAIDLYRKDKHYLAGQSEEDIITQIEQQYYEEFLPALEAKDQIELVRQAFIEKKYTTTDLKMIDLLLIHGSGKLKHIAKELEVNVQEARVIRQRVMRRAKRILLKINQPYGKAS